MQNLHGYRFSKRSRRGLMLRWSGACGARVRIALNNFV